MWTTEVWNSRRVPKDAETLKALVGWIISLFLWCISCSGSCRDAWLSLATVLHKKPGLFLFLFVFWTFFSLFFVFYFEGLFLPLPHPPIASSSSVFIFGRVFPVLHDGVFKFNPTLRKLQWVLEDDQIRFFFLLQEQVGMSSTTLLRVNRCSRIPHSWSTKAFRTLSELVSPFCLKPVVFIISDHTALILCCSFFL